MGVEKYGSTAIGDRSDFVKVPYDPGTNSLLAFASTQYYHVHGHPFVYPDHADEVLLTAGVGAWDLTGAITEVVPAGALVTSAFDLHWINISTISANGTIQIDIFSGAPGSEVQIGAIRATRTTVTSPNGPHRMQIAQQSLGNRISCRLSDSTAGSLTCLVSFEGHFYTP